MKCMCGSTKPGRTVAPLTSTTAVFGPRNAMTWLLEPIATKRPAAIATACAVRCFGAIVRNRPLMRIVSAGPATAPRTGSADAATNPPTIATNSPRSIRVAPRSVSKYGDRQ